MSTYALVTGASGGIGYEFAFELARRKRNVLLVARTHDKLADLKMELMDRYKIQCDFIALDLSTPAAPNQLYHWCQTNQYDVDILINNAGYGLFGYFEQQDISEVKNMMQLNMNTMVELCHLFLPMLKSKSRAYILNVASTSSYQAVPTLTVYAATKSFVVLFSRGLRYELKNTSVSVSCFSPGTTTTNFMDRAGMDALKQKAKKFSMEADGVARMGMEGMFKGKAEIIPGFINWISAKLTGFVPKNLTEQIAAGIYKDTLDKMN